MFDLPLREREVGGAILKPARARCAFKSKAMKGIHTFIVVAGVTATVQAQLVVTNPIFDVFFEVAHVEDIANEVT